MQALYLLYHELRPYQSDYCYAVETKQFESHADLFAQMRQSKTPGLCPEVTFDDGHMSDFEYALPILQSRGLTARFFITAGWTDKKPGYMGWRELRALHDSGQLIGAHGWSHTLLTHCTPKELNMELSGARRLLEDKLGIAITTMSLPGGRSNRHILAACREAGYTQVYTSAPRAEQVPPGFTVGRLNIHAARTLEWISNVLQPENKTLSSLERQYRIKEAAKTMLGDRLYEKLWALLNRKEPESDDSGESAE
jgi:peptidoglycan/xylan/chitin deacetylase (PgdA/CDA1 family)